MFSKLGALMTCLGDHVHIYQANLLVIVHNRVSRKVQCFDKTLKLKQERVKKKKTKKNISLNTLSVICHIGEVLGS